MSVDWSQFEPVVGASPAPTPKRGGVDWSQFEPVKPDDTGDFMRGAKIALGQTGPIAKGVVGLVGATAENVFGEGGLSTGLKNWGLRGYQEGMQKLAPMQRDTDELTTAWDKAKQGDLGALVDWAQYGLGYAVGQGGEALATSLLGAAAGAAIAPEVAPVTAVGGAVTGLVAKGAVKEAAVGLIEKAVLKEANRLMAESGGKLAAEQATKEATKAIAKNIGSTSALLAYGTGQELGSIYPEAEAEALKKGEKLNGGDLARVWATGLVAGGIEGLTDRLGVEAAMGKVKIPGVNGRVSNAALQGIGGAAIEGGTEAAQTAIERYGAGQDITSPEGIKDIINSAGLGAIGGAGIGGGAGLLHGKPQEAAAPEAPAEKPAETLLLGNAPDPYIVFKDGTTGKRSELEAYINGLPADQQIDARARLLGLGSQAAAPGAATAGPPGPLEFDKSADYLPPATAPQEPTTSLGAAPQNISDGLPFEPVSAIMGAGSLDEALKLADMATKPKELPDIPGGRTLEKTLDFMRADADAARSKSAELDTITRQAAEQDAINAALARAASAPALTPMQLALQRAREAKAQSAPVVTPEPVDQMAPIEPPKPEPRLVPSAGLFLMTRKGAERRAEQTGGELVRAERANGKMGYAVLPPGSVQPQPVTANEQDQALAARGNEAQAQPQAPAAAEAATPEAGAARADVGANAGVGLQTPGVANAGRDAPGTGRGRVSDLGAGGGTGSVVQSAGRAAAAGQPVSGDVLGVDAVDAGRGGNSALTVAAPAAAQGAPSTPPSPPQPSINGAEPRVIARVGRTPNSAQPIELRTNEDGTATPYLEGEAMLDFDSGEPIKLEAHLTDDEAKAAIRKAGAVSSKQNFYAPKDTKLSAMDDGNEQGQNRANEQRSDEPAEPPRGDGKPAVLQGVRDGTERAAESAADEAGVADVERLGNAMLGSGHGFVAVAPRPEQRALRAAADIAQRLFDKRVVFVRFTGKQAFNGVHWGRNADVIYLNADADRPALALVGHELVHALEKDNPALYRALVKMLEPLLQNEQAHREALASKNAKAASDIEATREELVADIVGDRFTEAEFWQEMADSNPSAFRKVAQAVMRLMDSLISKVINVRPFGTEQYLSDLKAARSAVAKVLQQYSEDRTDGKPEAGDEFKFSAIDRPLNAALEAADAVQRIIGAEPKAVGQTARRYTQAQRQAMDRVGFGAKPPTVSERLKAVWQDAGKKLAQGLADQFAPVKEISAEAYSLLRLSKGASGAFEAMLQGGKLKLTDNVYDFDETQRGGVVERLLKPLGGEHHDFFRWVAANRAEKLAAEGRENLFTRADIDAIKTLSQGVADFDYTIQHGVRKGQTTRDRTLIYPDALKTFNEFQNNVLDMAEQSGLIDGEARKLWQSEFYVPFYRVTEDSGVASMNIKGGVIRQQAFKQLKGGKDKLNADLLDNTLMNWAHLLDAAAKNRAAKATLEAAEKMGVAIPAGESTARELASSIDRKNGVVWFMDGGAKRFYVVDDPYLLTAINALEYAGMRGPVMDAMSAFKRVLTMGVTASPFFKVRNLIRDSVQVIGTSGISTNAAKNISEGWKATNPHSDEWFRLLAGGGTIHFGTMYEGAEAKRVQQLVEAGVDKGTILDSPNKLKAFYKKTIKPTIDAYNELGNRGEAINRASLYKQLKAQGMSHAEASLQARDLMDFSLQGSFSSIRFLSQVVPFLNARIQGLYKLGRAAKEDPQRFAAVIGAATAASLALLMAYGDDEDWKKREEWDRDNYWWFKIGGTAFRIPKPFEVGAIGTLAERSFEYAFDKEMTGKRFRERVLSLLGDNLSMNPIPQMVKPALDVYANVDSFTGRPIESLAMQKLKPEYRFNNSTSMAARAISTAANAATGTIGKESLSPVQVDQLLRGYFGWLGSFVITAGDILARPATAQAERATQDYWKSATGGMVANLEDAPSRYVSQMYKQAKEVEEAYATWRTLLKSGKVAEAAEFREENADAIKRYGMAEKIKKRESELSARIKRIEESDQSGDTKRELIRSLKVLQDSAARQLARFN